MFKSEQEMVGVVKESLKDLFGDQKVGIFEEIGLGNGVADIVICFYSKNVDFVNLNKSFLNYHDINIYHIVREKEEVTEDELIHITRSSKKEIRSSLNILYEESLIERTHEAVLRSRKYMYPFKRNVAIELKLKNWRRGLKQAYRYRWFADYSYLILDQDYSSIAIKNIGIFDKYNVGLATIGSTGEILRHFDPKNDEPFDPKMKTMFSEWLYQRQLLNK
jgi:predicted transcriptional regulator